MVCWAEARTEHNLRVALLAPSPCCACCSPAFTCRPAILRSSEHGGAGAVWRGRVPKQASCLGNRHACMPCGALPGQPVARGPAWRAVPCQRSGVCQRPALVRLAKHSGEYAPGADKIFREGYATDSEYQAREQSDHKVGARACAIGGPPAQSCHLSRGADACASGAASVESAPVPGVQVAPCCRGSCTCTAACIAFSACSLTTSTRTGVCASWEEEWTFLLPWVAWPAYASLGLNPECCLRSITAMLPWGCRLWVATRRFCHAPAEQIPHGLCIARSGEYVPAPGGTASAKFMEWHLKAQADESMQGGEVPSGVVLE